MKIVEKIWWPLLMLSFCKKFVWYIEYVVLNEYKWWTVNTYQSYVTDKHFKHSVEIMDSQDQEVHDERKEPQEEDIPNNTKKGKNDFLKSLKRVDPHWNLELQDTKEEVEDGADEDHKVDWATISWLGHHQSVCQVQTKKMLTPNWVKTTFFWSYWSIQGKTELGSWLIWQ